MVPSKTVDGSDVFCTCVFVMKDSFMSEVKELASDRFFGFGVFSSPECAASPSESSSFQAELW